MTREYMPEIPAPLETPDPDQSLHDKLKLLKFRKATIKKLGAYTVNASRSDFFLLGITEQEYQEAVKQAHFDLMATSIERLKDLLASIQEDIDKL